MSSRSVSERYSVRAICSTVCSPCGVEVRAAGVANEQRVAGQHEPRVIAAGVVGDEVGVVRERVAGGRDRRDLDVAERDHVAVAQRVVLELDTRAIGQVRGRAGAGDQIGQAGDVVGLHVRLEDRDDRRALGARRARRIARRGRRAGRRPRTRRWSCTPAGTRRRRSRRSAAVGSTRRPPNRFFVVRLDKLSSDLLNSNE